MYVILGDTFVPPGVYVCVGGVGEGGAENIVKRGTFCGEHSEKGTCF